MSLFEERMAPVDPSTAGSLPLGHTPPMLTPFSVTRISSDLDRNSFHKSGDQLALLLIVYDCIQNGEHAQVLPVIHSTSRWISPLASLFRGQ